MPKCNRRERVTGAEPRDDLPCDWCEAVIATTVEEVWCEADPTGHLVRLCQNCVSKCAGG